MLKMKDVCSEGDFVIGNTFFRKEEIHKLTYFNVSLRDK